MFMRKCGSVMKKDCVIKPPDGVKSNVSKVKEQANKLLCLYQKMSTDKVN